MAENVLVVEPREGKGKGFARKLRVSGRIPAVLYGRGRPSLPLTLDPASLERAIRKSEAGVNTLFDLRSEHDRSLGGKVVLVKELQRDPAVGRLLHADLYEVDLSRTVVVEVPIHLIGTARGVSVDGGILDHALRQLRVECLPRNIPDELRVDVSDLGIGDSIHVAQIQLPEGVELREEPTVSVVSVVAPAKEEVAPVAAAAVEGALPVEGAVPAEGAAPAEEPAEGE